jgi:hypothetical protein
VVVDEARGKEGGGDMCKIEEFKGGEEGEVKSGRKGTGLLCQGYGGRGVGQQVLECFARRILLQLHPTWTKLLLV